MRIYAKKAFAFEKRVVSNGQETTVESFVTKPGVFMDAPNWIQEDEMFNWAKADGDIEIVAGNEDVVITSGPAKIRTAEAVKAEQELMANIAADAEKAIEQATADILDAEATELPADNEAPTNDETPTNATEEKPKKK